MESTRSVPLLRTHYGRRMDQLVGEKDQEDDDDGLDEFKRVHLFGGFIQINRFVLTF